MGAGCSNRKSVHVKDSIKKGQIANLDDNQDVLKLSQDALEHLKMLQSQNPQNGDSLNFNSQQLKQMVGQDQQKYDDFSHKFQEEDSQQRLKHLELWQAVEINNITTLQNYLDQYEQNNGLELQQSELYDNNGNSIIHKAASLGHAESLMLLLERTGSKPDILNSSLATPLHLACKNNRIDAAKFLIGCGVDANIQDEHGQMPLLICCIHGHFDLAKMLIDASNAGHLPEPLEVDLKDHRGLSPLNCAAIKGDFQIVMLLVINGQAQVDGQSPKGCTPLLYAARGGYANVVRFLLNKGASPLRQDNAGGTVLHHSIEKGYIEVLTVLQEHGVDVYQAIEIPDNAGRTPIFEAVDNHETTEILEMLTKSKYQGGFGAKVNITNYNGQTPLFSAAREGNLEVIKYLVEKCYAKIDLTQGELYKEEYEEEDGQFESLQEKFFMDAYKNCMTPLQLSVILGNDDIMHYLIEKGGNPNLQTYIKGYTCLHLAVLANKPEIIIELLTKTQANPYLPDFGGRTLQDMVEIFLPSYLESFRTLLENLQFLKSKSEEDESLLGLINKQQEVPIVATHYYNPNDERTLKGIGQDEEKINQLYQVKVSGEEEENNKENDNDQNEAIKEEQLLKKLKDLQEDEIKTEFQDIHFDQNLVQIFGKKITKALYAVEWKYKEEAIKIIYKHFEKELDINNNEQSESIESIIKASAYAISITCKEKVIKVFGISLQLMNLLVTSAKIEKQGELFKNQIVEKNIVLKLLQKSEEGNTRITNKIHETLIDLSFNPKIGESLTSSFILQRIQAHNRALSQKIQQKNTQVKGDEQISQSKKIETENSLGNYKGLLAQLALLYKFINSFGIASRSRGPLSVKDILRSIVPALQNPNQDVRNAACKILLDVQKFSGCVTEEDLLSLNEKSRISLMKKIQKVEIQKNLLEANIKGNYQKNIEDVQPIVEEQSEETDQAEVPETISVSSPVKEDQKYTQFQDYKQIIDEKGVKKDWQERELALKAMEVVFQDKSNGIQFEKKDLLNYDFLQSCLILLKTCFEENNMTLYLLAVEVSILFFPKTLDTDSVYGSIQNLITPVILRTTDTNTRIRKRSVDLINIIWDHKQNQFIEKNSKLKFSNTRDSMDAASESVKKTESICQILAQVICEPQHGEKAIIGRLGLFIKKAQYIDGGKHLVNKPLQIIIGRNYEQLIEFACQWISHKNTKVRQNAQKLIVEVCRINCMDPRGLPFKQRIINYILGLRVNQRDILVQKINEVCLKHIVQNTSPGRANSLEAYINVEELDLMSSTKTRAASMDHVGAKRRLQSAQKRNTDNFKSGDILPQIAQANKPPVPGNQNNYQINQPIQVLPHSEPLNDEQKQTYKNLIDFLGIQIMTCFLSKNWATRFAAIQKVQEQIHNIDPIRRDAMTAEINKFNFPIEINFKNFLEFISEGIKDPVLKNYIEILSVFQNALPTFFRYIQPNLIQAEIKLIIQNLLRKTSDMKQKIRESTINFCLYLSHQSPIGPEYMINLVVYELNVAQNSNEPADTKQSQANTVAANFGNSHMIIALLGLLNEYQVQSQILQKDSVKKGNENEKLLNKFMVQINIALKHQNPQVRKEAEKLFKTLFLEFGSQLEKNLQDQNPQLQQKLISQAQSEMNQDKNLQSPKVKKNEEVQVGVKIAHDQIRDQALNLSKLKTELVGIDEHLQSLKNPNLKIKQSALVEIQKLIQKKIFQGISQDKARELFESLSILLRHLLQGENSEIYLEALNFLKFIVGSFSPFLSSLDLHLMMGSFIGLIIQNSVTANIRAQVSTDKIIIFFAKNKNIGSLLIAKEICKNIDKINKSLTADLQKQVQLFEEKKNIQLRFYGILLLLIQQFSIILCYQNEFYSKCLECLADTLILITDQNIQQAQQNQDDNSLKNICVKIITLLYSIDYKILDQNVGKLDNIKRKTPLRKIIIEHESHQKQGKVLIEFGQQNSGEQNMRMTQNSFASSFNRQSLFSPGGSTINRDSSPAASFQQSLYGNDSSKWSSRFQNENRSSFKKEESTLNAEGSSNILKNRRMISMVDQNRNILNQNESNKRINQEHYFANHPTTHTQTEWRKQQDLLPSIQQKSIGLNKTGVLIQNTDNNLTSGIQQYQFEAPGYKSNDRKQTFKAQSDISQKFKLKSTGGAGFSSQQATNISEQISNQQLRSTPRRTFGSILNNNRKESLNSHEVSKDQQLKDKMFLGGLENSLQQLKMYEDIQEKNENVEQAKNTRTIDSTNYDQKINGSGIKPPLYVPAKRQPSENNRLNPNQSQEKFQNAQARLNSNQRVQYKPKTGFSSLNQQTETPEKNQTDNKQYFNVSKSGNISKNI